MKGFDLSEELDVLSYTKFFSTFCLMFCLKLYPFYTGQTFCLFTGESQDI
jgi:hypothetical protein